MKKKYISIAVGAVAIAGLLGFGFKDHFIPIASSSAGDISKAELEKALKEQSGQAMLYHMMVEKIINEKYPIADADVTEALDELKEQAGESFDQFLQSQGIPSESELKDRIRLNMAIEKAIKDTVTEEDVEANHKPEIRASHILVETEEKAKEVKDKLNSGTKFEDVAKEYSTDPGSKEKGGDLDFFGPGKMVKEFEDAAYALEVGQVSEPVKSSHGYHIIKVTDKKELKPFDEVKDSLRETIEMKRLSDPEWQNKVIKEALADADIKVKDSDLKDTFKAILEK
ncbi:peptidylprolyl isomerase [Priestia taiwanensis]|uniref:Foldase protein PrsA n=1 Tax=Priestia taiwanensis TaxID=1347902 RepID=A0A917ET69_9BACI|nr:peptidylprolyl isomerase [Priestia taiwanensis]MBM7363443.1 foldase protein PrsA [Priestia taiwanensis]GGE77090.1 foldase protein PrsA 4 [Priestia taiwanensis]